MGVVRVTAMAPGSVEYLLHGCDSHPEQTPEQGVDVPGVDGPEHSHGAWERTSGAAEYLTSAVEHGEPDGVWFGAGLEALGLPARAGDTATAEDVRAIFGQLRYPEHVVAGSTEKTPVYLGSKPRRFRTAAQIVADALKAEPEATAERRFEIETSAKKNTRTPTAYYDVTFSPVKSVSLYYTALLAAGDVEGAELVRAAHEQAVRIALSAAEADVAYVRSGRHEGRGPSGRTVGEWEAATGLAAVVYGHHTNRDGEPQLHSHAGVLNRAATADGRVLALDGQAFKPVKDAMATAYTRAYQQLLTESMGVVFELRPDGVAREIAGIDAELLAAASTRTHEKVRPRVAELVEAYTARHGRAPGARAKRALVEQAVKDTRKPKTGLAGPAAVAAWAAGDRGRAARLAAALDAVDERVMAAAASGRHPGVAGVDGPTGLTGQVSGREAARLVLAEIDGFHAATAAAVDGHAAAGEAATTGVVAADRGLSRLGFVVDQALVAGVEGVQAKYATWTVGNLTAAIDEHLGDHAGIGVAAGQRPAFVAALAEAVLAEPGRYGVVQVSAGDPVPVQDVLRRTGPGGDGRSMFRAHIDERYATTTAIAGEERLRALTHTQGAATVAEERVEAAVGALSERGLSGDQAAVVAGVLGSGRTVDVLVGPAGTGKSHTVGALAGAWQTEMGGRVLGLATAKIAAQNLDGLGLEGMTTAAFRRQFLEPDAGTGQVRQRLGAGDLVVVDEAGMSSTAELIEIADLAAAAGAKVLLTGDHHQLQPVGAGGMFAHLAAGPGVFELDTVHRFAEAWEAEASLQLRAGQVSAVAAYTDRGRVRTGSLEEMAEHAVRGHLADMLDGKQALLIVDTNQMAAELSRKVHKELVRLGHVSPDVLTRLPDETEVGVGDLIQTTCNDGRQRVDPGPDGTHRPVTNKQRYTVLGRDEQGQLLVQDDHGATAHLSRSYVEEHVRLAYAVTNHAAQGVTVDVGRAVTGRDATRESLYPAITRGRSTNLIYLVTEQDPDAHDPRRIADTAAQRLADVVARSEVDEAAVTVRESAEHDMGSFATLGALMNQVSMRAAGTGNDEVLAGLLTADQYERLRTEPAYGRMLNKVYAAQLDGHDPRTLLGEAVGMRGFTTAEDLSKVLHWRLGRLLEHREPERDTTVPGAEWTTVADTLAAGEVRDYLHALGELAQHRQHHLGQQIAEQPPTWARERLPEIPDPHEAPQERAEWERRAGLVAAYREYRGIGEDQSSLGQAPPAEQPFAYALWRQATEALDPDPTALAWQHKDTTELYQARETWALELYRADEYGPRAVGEELAATRRLAAEIRDDALLARAEADAPDPTRDRAELLAAARRHHELADTYTAEADALTSEYEARQQWWEQTAPLREADQAAAVELERRNLPAWRDTTPTTAPAGEQLALPDMAEPGAAAVMHDSEPTSQDPSTRTQQALDTLGETTRPSQPHRGRPARAPEREQQQRAVHDAYTQRAHQDQLRIEADRNTSRGQTQPGHGYDRGQQIDHGRDDLGYDDYGYDLDDDY